MTADSTGIADVLVRYASGIDRRDWDLFRSCFTADVHADYGDPGVFTNLEDLTEFMVTSHADMGHTLHRISNIHVEIDGDRARARSYVDAVLLDDAGESGLNPIGYYDDDLVRRSGEWKISRRRVTIAIYRIIG